MMAEDKTLRYGLIVLGFFLIMVGMFIMNVDKPEVYATFCCIGILMVVVGIIWSICQCYPKITFVPPIESDTEHLFPQKHQIPTSLSECGVPLQTSSQSPYTSCEEAEQFEKNLPIYGQIQHWKVISTGDPPGVNSLPTSLQSEHMDIEGQSSVKAEALVHRDSGSDGETCTSDISLSCRTKGRGCSEAPLATFQESLNTSVSPSSSNSLSLLRHRSVLPSCFRDKGLNHPARSENTTLIDSVSSDSPSLCNQLAASTSEIDQRDATSIAIPLPFKLEQSATRESQKQESQIEAEMFYGIYDEEHGRNPYISEESEQEEFHSDEISV
ncbi:barttin [Heterodontus francisci]|uniref:barttin n=1 Tax=Heterodontus francisci TaxID=7792 RepID=UPI00355B4EEF